MSCSAESAMRSASWQKNLLLARKLQQTQNVDPQPGHEMPVPSRDIHHDAPPGQGKTQKRSDAGATQRKNAAEQVNRVRAGQQINKGAARRRRHVEPTSGQLAPRHPLTEKKNDSECKRHRQPW